MIEQSKYQVVFAIVNDGYTDLVMNAAKTAGARGGTVLSARGTGNKDIAKFYGIVITPEKQIIMILVPLTIRDAVISAISKEAGINTKSQGIIFSIPAEDAVGIVEEGRPQENVAGK